jgi:hypothetical protein
MRGCGEWNETVVDASAGTKQTYVEDCYVCWLSWNEYLLARSPRLASYLRQNRSGNRFDH